ncbi:MAG: flap endonuclease-1 [Candidatus Micrarchaeota archaeon]
MGVDLGDLSVKHPISLDSLSGKAIAIDAYNMLYQFLASIRQEDGMPLMDFKGNVTAHLSGLFYRTCKLMENGIKPIYVFDGKPNVMKGKVQAQRSEIKKKAEEKWKEALEHGRYQDAKKYAQATSKLTKEMVAESKILLQGMGVPFVQASSDGEAQASMMVEKGIAYATASQDYDALLFGSNRLVRNLSITGRRKVPRQDRYILVEPEMIELKETLASLGIGRDGLIFIGILLGTDFNDGVKRVGPKTALKIVKENKTLDSIVDYVKQKYDYQFEVDAEDVFNIFLDPPYVQADNLKWNKLNTDALTKLLVDQHDFSKDRVGNTLTNLQKIMDERSAQSKLDEWF